MSTREEELGRWLQEGGIEGNRRLVREAEAFILVSKFEDGFASELIARLGRLPALFDPSEHASRYLAIARLDPGITRAEAWHGAALEILREQAAISGLGPFQVAEVAAGIDSVAALLDTVLFMGASPSSNEGATAAEREAYRDALDRMDADRGIFTRAYGSFQGKAVVNHCPGAKFAREIFELAWDLCSVPTPPGPPETTRTQPPPAVEA